MSIRKFIQSKLDELMDIEVGTELPDDMLIQDKVYFSYLLNDDLENEDFEHYGTRNITIIGYLKVKTSLDVDSLNVIDNAQEQLKNKLKEINFKTSYNDVSIIDNIRKIQVRARAKYNEINNGLI